MYDLFGIVFEGHADLRRLMMPDDWEGHPLRKDYPVQVRKDAATFMPLQVTEEEFKANMERDRHVRPKGRERGTTGQGRRASRRSASTGGRGARAHGRERTRTRSPRRVEAMIDALAAGRSDSGVRQRRQRRRRAALRGGAGGALRARAAGSIGDRADDGHEHLDGGGERSRASSACSRGRSKRLAGRAMSRWRLRRAARRPTWCGRSKPPTQRGLVTIALTGRDGGEAGSWHDARERAGSSARRWCRKSTPRCLHVWCELIDAAD